MQFFIQQPDNGVTSKSSSLTTVRTLSPWTLVEYPNNLVEMWRYATISATDKTNTFSLPTPLKDNQFGVKAFPVFNGHLCHAIWAGTKTGGDGRTTTTVQISMESTDSDSNVGIMLYVTGYKPAA